MNIIKGCIAIFSLFLFLSGCGGVGNNHTKDSQMALMKTTNPKPTKLTGSSSNKAAAIKREVRRMNEIYDVSVVEGKKDILVAYKVKHLSRFKMKKIEKNLKETLEKQYPHDHFVVSSDYKIFLESVRLKEDLDAGKISKKEANKRFKRIIKLSKELT
ncbi:MAG: YhcN/YlaJ family sporulation lipoprotein [Bacillales bacterium]|nr:YhcN/YlaJ family sporulation lipoprotein [Bacillales bacterium]